jgi:hypothetical protein
MKIAELRPFHPDHAVREGAIRGASPLDQLADVHGAIMSFRASRASCRGAAWSWSAEIPRSFSRLENTMTKHFISLFAVSAALLAGCSSGDGEITVDGAKTPLTDNPNDDAVTVTVKDAPDTGYALDKVTVKAKAPDKEAIDLSCTTNDLNANKLLDKGDTIACKEGAANDLGADLAGKDIDIELHAQVDGEDKLVGEATWTPAAK